MKTIAHALKTPSILRVLSFDGLPAVSSEGQTRQAREQLLAALPHRDNRDYTINDLIEHRYEVVNGRYRVRR